MTIYVIMCIPNTMKQKRTFVNGGFRNWNHEDGFGKHDGGLNSAHSQAQEK